MNAYDSIAYPSLVHAQTHPDRLAVAGRLMGLAAAHPESCRVLELGCGDGANLVCMAELLPGSRFAGVDVAPLHTEAGSALIARLGLTNVELRLADIQDLAIEEGGFDYIIAHGLYSWVPAEVRGNILRIMRRGLAPQGIGYLSFNAFPGWHSLQALREMMLYRIRDIAEPMEAAARARELVSLLAAGMRPEAGVFREFVRSYDSSFLGRGPTSDDQMLRSLIHDELAETNQPFYFHEVVAAARGVGLQYLSEADLQGATAAGLPRQLLDEIRGFATDLVDMEQYLDFFRNRGFRRILLCRQETPVSRVLSADARAASGLHFASPARVSRRRLPGDDGSFVRFMTPSGQSFTATSAVTQAAFLELRRFYPRTLPFVELLARACRRAGTSNDAGNADRLAHDLIAAALLSRSLVEMYLAPRPLAAGVPRRPRAPGLTRLLAASGAEEAPNLRHEYVKLGAAARRILPLLDGTRDVAKIQADAGGDRENTGLGAIGLRETLLGLRRGAMLEG